MSPPSTEVAAQELAACLDAARVPTVDAQTGLAAARRAQHLAQQLQRSEERAQAGAICCTFLQRLGRHAELLAEAEEVLPQLSTPNWLNERHELLRLVTLCGSEIGRFDRALDAAHELVAASRVGQDPRLALTAAFSLAVCLERMGDSWQAERLLREALQAWGDEERGRPWLVAANALTAVSVGMAHQLTLTGADAERDAILRVGRWYSEQALLLLDQVNDPMISVAVHGNLGEIRLLQGEVEAARPLLDLALQYAQAHHLHAYAWRVRTTLADWNLASGQPLQSRDMAQTLLREMGTKAPQQTAIRAHHAAYRACRALRQYKRALEHLESAERLERARATAQLKSQSQLFVSRMEAQRANERAEQAHADAQLHRQRAADFAAEAELDPLTGLGNRRHLERRCGELLPMAQRESQSLSLAVLDIDRFKQINDEHGHGVGDQVLVRVAQLLRERTRAGDVLARHGGEEFVIVLPDMNSTRAIEVCERLRESLELHPWAAQGLGERRVTASIGLAQAPAYDLQQLLLRADTALYRAKEEGRNRLRVAPRQA